MKWSEEAWKAAEEVYRQILEQPFVSELADGTLDCERFMFYISQDSLYVANYVKVLAHVAGRLPRVAQMRDFLTYATEGIAIEEALHEFYLKGKDISNLRPTPTCLLYNSFEASKALGSVEVEAAAVLPCFWVYQKVGESILARCSKDNPYYHWIETYGDEAFAQSVVRAIEICDELAEASTPEIRRQMTEAFVTATRMEWMFWDSAYRLEKWPV